MPVPFNIVGIDHVVLRAADPTKLERFYLDALGLTFEKRQGELAQFRAGKRADRYRASRRGRARWRYIKHRRGEPRPSLPENRAV